MGSSRLAIAIGMALAVVGFAAAVVAAGWTTPDKGFLAFTGHRVVTVEEGGPADRAGLRPDDVIVGVDGQTIDSTIDYIDAVLTRDVGDRVELQVDRDGERHTATVQLEPASPPIGSIFALALAVLLIGLGFVALFNRPDDLASIRFFRTTLIYAAVYTASLSWTSLLVHPSLTALSLLTLFLAPPIALDFALSFPERVPGQRTLRLIGWVPSVLLLGGAGASVMVALQSDGAAVDAALQWTSRLVSIHLGLTMLVLAVGNLAQLRNLSRVRGRGRGQLKWLLFGFVLALLPGVFAIPAAIQDTAAFLLRDYKPYLIVIAALYFAAAALAVLRVRLADVDAVITRSAAYAIASGIAVGVYFLLALGLGAAVDLALDAPAWLSQLVAALGAAAAFGPIRDRVSRWLDRRFLRDRVHYVEALRELSEEVLELREPAELGDRVVSRAVAALRAESGALYLAATADRPTLARVASVSDDFPDEMSLTEALRDPESGVAVPLPASSESGTDDGRLAGVLLLGPRLGGDLYSTEDRALLGALAAHLGVSLSNARAYGTIASMTRTLEQQNQEIRDLRDKLEDENRYLKGRLEQPFGERPGLAGNSKAMKELRRQIERVAPSEAVVLLLGETGSGKGLSARAIHDTSARADGPFIVADMSALPKGVIESELFGHERGAFTGAVRNRRGAFELAEGGTLFLDEIGELPLDMQPKLLRALQDRTIRRVGGERPVAVDVRIIAATNRDLKELAKQKKFREDLYYRLAVVEIRVPPLRDRRADVPALATAVLPKLCRRNHRPELRLTEAALERMQGYGWRGNVRELQNVLERAVVLCERRVIDADDLVLPDTPVTPKDIEVSDDADHREVMETIERDRLVAALDASGGNRSSAARALGIPRTTFLNKLRRYGLH